MILAGDIGGTKTVLGLFSRSEGGIVTHEERLFPSGQFAGIEQILEAFLQGKSLRLERACLGVAGPIVAGRSETTNLPWTLDARQLSERFRIPAVMLLNDLEAMAYGTLALGEREMAVLNRGAEGRAGNRALIAAGTGLGEAILFWDGRRYRPSASEGGHCDFAPRSELEIALLEYWRKQLGHVSYERVLSGPGLLAVYQFLRDTGRGEEPPWLAERLAKETPPAVISEVALSGKADLCIQALDLFVSIYGAEAGNLALKALATGGLFVGGGIAPKILEKLRDGTFMRAFADKGRYGALMREIPVRVILNEKTALLGAAHYGLTEEGGPHEGT